MQTSKGKLVAIGGNEDKGTVPAPDDSASRNQLRFFDQGILKRIHDELPGPGTRIEVITTASSIPEEMGKMYTDAFLLLGCDNVGVLPIQQPCDAANPLYLDRLREANAVMFTGGDQERIRQVFLKTEALQILKCRYEQEEMFLISGTSAGAMALSKTIIDGSIGTDSLVKGKVELKEGMNLIDGVIIDTHFVNRRRMPRLIEAIARVPSHIGIGLGEDTGILIKNNACVETIGSGLVIILDGRRMEKNNYRDIREGEALCLENLILHVLPKGQKYNLQTGKFM
ncbi:cyanophycinase [Pontibacter sp. HJ8]